MSDQKPVEQTPAAETDKHDAVETVESSTTPVAPVADTNTTDTATKPNEPAKIETGEAEAEEGVKDEITLAAAPEPETAKPEVVQQEEQKPQKPAYVTKIPSLSEFFDHLPAILSKSGHDEMWGVPLKGTEDIPTVNVLIKFLRANEGNLSAAEDQLRKALEWRKQTKPLELIESGRYSASKYGGLGYLTTYEEDGRPLVFTWNIYGAVKDMTKTFSDSDEFVKWRAALMELAVQDLKMKDATTVIDYDGEKDPYQMIQVHDYLNVKFFRMDPAVRAATKKTIDVFSTAYPELLREKFFVNVPSIMGWMFSAMKLILSRNTTRKFHPITNGVNLAREFPAIIADKLPKTYGGKGADLKDEARTVQLINDKEEKKEEPKEEEAKEETKPTESAAEVAAKPEEVKEASKDEPAKEEPAPVDSATEGSGKAESQKEKKEETQ
ncbi:uncharacterized protein N7469_002746 [Penicillium citrinum]|uniref:Phosphatidylinositol transfer protein SFH5 n=1 Tax=Penicillium citrinum TaxID=5077 RepID=A0A9W9PB66_PENCI|nr:uncharacterized protein N7469_002746 [Penicillium citrinum]KAJ5241155.1 hypothetical protein N7469_002746 [Penicillium citrinum]